ncbi:DUF427 domain-containing protein [Mycobacterium sp. CPCC 205372]|uniref:DUF427 domain-containing protein n=1 Tax=Mycobacterium hippophais TaxID=3016340 RepID=A0ABT4PXU1_9MYCO|nr:DUF427 domain-containing protein [Mycobacterium hippophais]MCZ8381394.1 DUF427 domain-containing protein [Mycobacterium hippophais]
MAIRMLDALGGNVGALRFEPTEKRVRVSLGGEPVADTCRARLVWEPRRIVPAYAVPIDDLTAQLVPAGAESGIDDDDTGRPVLDPSVPFASHSCAGTPYDVIAGDQTGAAAAFAPEDSDLDGYAILQFDPFDWREEDERIVGHPHDPFSRIDVLRSDRHVVVELDGTRLAESTRPMLLFETQLPVRFYLPREDVTADLEPSDTASYCAYKGRAHYFSLPGGPRDLAWTYPDPLHDAEPVRDRVCFFDEKVDVVVDGHRRDRPTTPWS